MYKVGSATSESHNNGITR